MNFNQWLDTLIQEKGINTEQLLEVEGQWGLNLMPLQVVINACKATGTEEKKKIKNTLVMIDFKNGDIVHYFKHLAQALAI